MCSKGAILVTLLLLSSPESPKPAAGTDLDRLQGEWTLVASQGYGADSQNGLRCTVRDEKVSFLRGDKVVEEVTIKVDSAKMPKAIDAALASKQVAPGIYKCDADTFTLCYAHPGQPRPNDFTAPTASSRKLSVWKRPAIAKPKA